ncbi:hypothetical protein [uncultured Prevotella sp.]|jgi:hypothetical protein|uniref:hypothetical protein n=1 Tax=uncultured Prevotella sp. TaxID=159272 RepID=UPI00263830D8|nr:hypothetical protein [uncultured Prevotella sp.]
MKKILLLVFSLFFLNSCIIDYKPAGYFVYNHTKDTLLIEMTESETLTDSIYWGIHSLDSVLLDSEQDTICVSVKGEKVAFWRFNYVLPYSESGSIYPLPDTCYVYVIKWNIAKSYSFEEIRDKKLYDRRVVSRKDFDGHVYEYW